MTELSNIDLSNLPAPNVVESLNYEQIIKDMLDQLIEIDTKYDVLVESDPAYKILEIAAYRELLLRNRINDASKALMLAFARKADLDHRAALFGVKRLSEEVNGKIIYETDEQLRRRTVLSLNRFSSAGPIGAYMYHALTASIKIKDVSVYSPDPGVVDVIVMSYNNKGVPDAEIIKIVEDKLLHPDIKPLTDHVFVKPPEVIDYEIECILHFFDGPDKSIVAKTSNDAVKKFVEDHFLIGLDIVRSGLFGALHQEGIQNVELIKPTQDLVISESQVAFCTGIEIIEGEIRE